MRTLTVVAATVAMVATATVSASGAAPKDQGAGDVARYVLPPGNYGGLPTTANSFDQLPLYSALTPLRDQVTDTDIQNDFLPENFAPIGETTEIATGRPGLKLVYDQYGIPHIYGQTRADVAFGAGWVTARDRMLLLQLGRGPARVAVADVPGINAFSLVTSGQTFVPSAATEALVTKQADLIVQTYGEKGKEMIADMQAEADGMNAYARANNIPFPPATVNDVIAVTAFIGSIFGSGGGAEAQNADFLARLQQQLGAQKGYKAWEDTMLLDNANAPTTLQRPFFYGPLTGGKVRGSVVIDPGSIIPLDPRQPGGTPAPQAAPATAAATPASALVDATQAPPRRHASNFLVVNPNRSASRNTLAVMGPQLGYYYPEIVEQVDLHGPGINAQGVAVPGASMYILIGRTPNYAWSLTSAGSDIVDVFTEPLCEPNGATPTRASGYYLYRGKCQPFEEFDAGTLNGTPIRYPVSVHGPVIGTATVQGKPYALTRQRSTFGRDGLNLAALKDMTDGVATTPEKFFRTANEFGFTFNWAYANRSTTAYFSSALLPQRAKGLDRRLPTLGTGEYDWQGFLPLNKHPHGMVGPEGLLLNWNNKAAPGYMHGDDEPFGSVQHVELFDKFPPKVTLAQDVGVMNRAATEDDHAIPWPVVSQVLHGSPAPNPLAAQALALVDQWVQRDAPLLDLNGDGKDDDPGVPIMRAVWDPIAEAVMRPVFGNLLPALDGIRNLSGASGESYVDQDLRTLVDPQQVRSKFHLRYCGNGNLDACRASLWQAFATALEPLVASQGSNPSAWRAPASRTGFVPGLIPTTFPTTNRPTFQQVLELQARG